MHIAHIGEGVKNTYIGKVLVFCQCYIWLKNLSVEKLNLLSCSGKNHHLFLQIEEYPHIAVYEKYPYPYKHIPLSYFGECFSESTHLYIYDNVVSSSLSISF